MDIAAPQVINRVEPAPAADAPETQVTDRGRRQEAPRSMLQELRELVRPERLEVRIQQLPDNGGTIYRIVDPATGRVIREFPSERLARVLAEIRARAAAHLDADA